MGLMLNKINDPRDSLQKARRKELEKLAHAHGLKDVQPGMPADLMRRVLRRHGITSVHLPRNRYLGGPPDSGQRPSAPEVDTQPADAEVNALDDLERQWQAEQQAPESQPAPDEAPDPRRMNMGPLRKLAKERGLKIKPSDKKADIIARLEA